MIKLSEASVMMYVAVIVRVSRTSASETSTLYEHLLSVMSGSLGKIKLDILFWLNRTYKYSDIATNLYNRQFINLAYSQSRQ